MKVSGFLILLCALLASSGLYAQHVSVSLKLENATVYEALNEISKQSGYLFIFRDDEVVQEKKITISVENAGLEEALHLVLKNTGLEYELMENYIVLRSVPKIQRSLTQLFQQTEKHRITGRVIADADNLPLSGVHVYVKGTTTGTTTDLDGGFELNVPKSASVLVFSLMGMKTVEVPINGKSEINIRLEEDQIGLDELIVIAFGSVSRKLLLGSISDYKPANLEEMPVPNLDMAMQGRMAGVMVTQNSGTPGSGITVRIRGNNSISADNQPLYVVDGIPVLSGDFSQVGYSGQGISAISDINPNDIESFTILKDAAAAAIYGARASRGVILINTKRGDQQKTRFQFSSSTGFQKVSKKLKMLDASQWMQYRNDLREADGLTPQYSADMIANPPVNTNWLNEVFRTGIISRHELSTSNANDKTAFFISLNYHKEEGTLKGTDFNRLGGRLNFDHQVNPRLKIGSGVTISNSHMNRVEGDQSLNGPLPNAISLPPIYPVYNSDGTYNEDGPYANPVAIANEAINKSLNFRTMANVFANYYVLNGLSFETKWAVDFLNLEEHSYDPVTTRQGKKYNGLGYDANTRATSFITNNLLRYGRHVRENDELEAMLGYSFERFIDKRVFIRGIDFPNAYFQYMISAANITNATSSTAEDRTNSYFGRLKYNMDNKYLLSVSLRYDGSSNFGANNRYGLFPALAGGWRISEEPFFNNAGLIEELKIRGSYGLTGNDKISRYASLSLFDGRESYNRQPAIYPVQMPNPDLKWETSSQLDLGADVVMCKSRVSLSFDYYYSITRDLLLARPLPPSSGYSSVWENIGEMENRGIELSVSTLNITNPDFNWLSTLAFTSNRNKILKLYKGQPVNDIGRGSNYIGEGQPFGVFYGYRSLGVDPSTGDIVFEDVNGDGVITAEDRTRIGNPNPKFYGGLENSINYKQFSFRVFLQFCYGNDIFNGTRVYIESLKGEDNQLTDILNRWRQPGDITNIPRAISTDPNNNNRTSSRFIEDGSYIRIKEVTLSYAISSKNHEMLGPYNMKVFLSAYNLFTLTKYSGMDPESNYAGNDNLRMGTDFFTYPQSRRVTLGVSIGF